ncbi:HotDog domain-containing protein [Cenococcum geophilum]
MADTRLEPGTTATSTLTVSAADLASAISSDPSDAFLAVISASRLVALMEIASPGQLSIEMAHSAPTPPGTVVTAVSRYTGKEGKQFAFEVVASDPGGEIGKAVHKRAIVDVQRLEEGARKRVGVAFAGTLCDDGS